MRTASCALIAASLLFSCANAILSSTSGSISYTYAQANGNDPLGSPDLPLQSLARSVPGLVPDQVKVIHWGNNSYLISWLSSNGQVGPSVVPPPANLVQSMVFYSSNDKYLNTSTVMNASGISLTYTFDYTKDVTEGYLEVDYARGPGPTLLPINYVSGVIHHVLVEGLMPSTTYYYKVGDPRYYNGVSGVLSFKTLGALVPTPSKPSVYPFRLGIIADVGQTYNTSAVLARLMEVEIDAVALIGDFTYADNYDADGCMYYSYKGVGHCPFTYPEGDIGEQTYQPRWDTFGRLSEPLLSKTPFFFTNGNHEIEELPTGARFTSVNARYPGPPADGIYSSIIHDFTNQLYLQTIVQGQPTDDEFDPMGAYKNMFYSADVPGAKLIFLTTFIGGDDFSSSSVQYKWFLSELKKVDRTLTPWLIVNFHFPMYTSYAGSYLGVECFRQSYEPLFYQYGVDLVFNGHVHSYERTNPVYNYSLNSCGTVHMTVGDGGNNEGITQYYNDEVVSELPYCAPGKATTRVFPEWQPQACFSYPAPGGAYCYTSQPNWSAYRSPSWGFGVLTILNETTAHWLWNNTDNGSTAFDEAYFTRNPACLNGVGAPPEPPAVEAPPPEKTHHMKPPRHAHKHRHHPPPPRKKHHHHHHKEAGMAVEMPL